MIVDRIGVNLYNYAVRGASCSNEITPRSLLTGLYPSVHDYQVGAYVADSKFQEPDGTMFMHAPPNETVYAIWIGTNDLGVDAFITDSEVQGKTVSDYVDCVYEALDTVFANGGRFMAIMNLIPLDLTPMYQTTQNGGVGGGFSNRTQVNGRMRQTVAALNDIYHYRTAYEALVAKRYPGAFLAVFDAHSFVRICLTTPVRRCATNVNQINEIYNNPGQFLDSPANVTGFIHHCTGSNCTDLPNLGEFMWEDALHPSVRTDSFIADEMIKVALGTSEFATYYHAK
jgi:hypothetical protein